jgi:hypothetical protein
MTRLFLRSCKLPGGDICPPCLPYCQSHYNQQGPFAPRALLRLIATMNPSDSLSPSTDFPVIPVIRLPAPQISPRDEEGLSSCLACPCHRAVASTPPECKPPRRSGCSDPCCLHSAHESSTSGMRFRGHLCVHFRYGPMTRSPSLKMALSIDSRVSVSLHSAIQATRLLAITSVGLSPTEHTSLSLDMRRVEDWRHTARCGLSVGSPFPLGVPH